MTTRHEGCSEQKYHSAVNKDRVVCQTSPDFPRPFFPLSYLISFTHYQIVSCAIINIDLINSLFTQLLLLPLLLLQQHLVTVASPFLTHTYTSTHTSAALLFACLSNAPTRGKLVQAAFRLADLAMDESEFNNEIRRLAAPSTTTEFDRNIVLDRFYTDRSMEIDRQLSQVLQPMGWARKYLPGEEPGEEPDVEHERIARQTQDWFHRKIIPEYELYIDPLPSIQRVLDQLWVDLQRGLSPDAVEHLTWSRHRLSELPEDIGEDAWAPSDYQLNDIGLSAYIDREIKAGMLLHDMGLGKTFQCLMLHYVNKQSGPALIVAPVGLLSVWKEEIEKSFPGAKIFEYKDMKTDPQTAQQLARFDFVLVSFHRVSNEFKDGAGFASDQELRLQGIKGVGPIPAAEKEAAKLENREAQAPPREPRTDIPHGLLHEILWERVIIDEAHRIRNNGAFAMGCYNLRRKFTTLATGTPQMNDYMDWFPLMRMTRVMYAKHFELFFGGKKRRESEWAPLDETAAIALGVILRGMSVRRMKDSKFNGKPVLPPILQKFTRHSYKADDGTKYRHGTTELGGKTEKECQVKLEYLWSRWEKVPHTTKRKWLRVHSHKPEFSADSTQIFVELLQARLTAIHPSILLRKSDSPDAKYTTGTMEPNEWKALMSEGDNWKSSHLETVVAIAKEHFEDPNCGGLIIFSEYLAPLDLVEIGIEKTLGRDCLRRDGSVSDKEKIRNIRWFKNQFEPNEGENYEKKRPIGPLILLMTSRSGGEGLNLPQGNRTIILCPSFNPYVDIQAWNRMLRRGQLLQCFIHVLFLEMSYEERASFIHDRKMNNAESILDLTPQQIERARGWTEDNFKALVSKEHHLPFRR